MLAVSGMPGVAIRRFDPSSLLTNLHWTLRAAEAIRERLMAPALGQHRSPNCLTLEVSFACHLLSSADHLGIDGERWREPGLP